jgi:hypothetical protein
LIFAMDGAVYARMNAVEMASFATIGGKDN